MSHDKLYDKNTQKTNLVYSKLYVKTGSVLMKYSAFSQSV